MCDYSDYDVGYNWVKVNNKHCQTALLSCCAGGHIPILSYLYSQWAIDLQSTGMGYASLVCRGVATAAAISIVISAGIG